MGISVSEQAGGGGRQRSIGQIDFNLATLPRDDFPVIVEGDLPTSFEIPARTLAQLIDATRFAISTEETRYYLNGIYFHIQTTEDSSMLTAVATDGHRLARMQVEAPQGSHSIPGIIIPRKTALELKKLIESTEN